MNKQFDYRLGKERKFTSHKIEANSPKIKTRNKSTFLNNWKTGPINPTVMKLKTSRLFNFQNSEKGNNFQAMETINDGSQHREEYKSIIK